MSKLLKFFKNFLIFKFLPSAWKGKVYLLFSSSWELLTFALQYPSTSIELLRVTSIAEGICKTSVLLVWVCIEDYTFWLQQYFITLYYHIVCSEIAFRFHSISSDAGYWLSNQFSLHWVYKKIGNCTSPND